MSLSNLGSSDGRHGFGSAELRYGWASASAADMRSFGFMVRIF